MYIVSKVITMAIKPRLIKPRLIKPRLIKPRLIKPRLIVTDAHLLNVSMQ